MQNLYYMEGKGTRLDAIFAVDESNKVLVVAELSGVSYIDRTVSMEEARFIWRTLEARGFRRVSAPRRTISELRVDIRD